MSHNVSTRTLSFGYTTASAIDFKANPPLNFFVSTRPNVDTGGFEGKDGSPAKA
jgi:hypothetical protein